jgi:uncharacterized membrane protein YjjB (DUF3815 family)
VDLLFTIIQDAFWSSLAALGFAMLFNVPSRALGWCALAGAFGHATLTLLMESGAEIAPATLVGASVVGFYATGLARYYKMPSVVFSVSGVIPMVPGVFAYRTMIALLRISTADTDAALEEALFSAFQNGIITGLVLAALAAGIAAPTLLFERRKPVV